MTHVPLANIIKMTGGHDYNSTLCLDGFMTENHLSKRDTCITSKNTKEFQTKSITLWHALYMANAKDIRHACKWLCHHKHNYVSRNRSFTIYFALKQRYILILTDLALTSIST